MPLLPPSIPCFQGSYSSRRPASDPSRGARSSGARVDVRRYLFARKVSGEDFGSWSELHRVGVRRIHEGAWVRCHGEA